ncbi:MAG: RluA family pseudouridine synthase [Muribaculaceae bacterium]|nr:RluA family pseudouridine synthase [Muribaculaceae bacterium]
MPQKEQSRPFRNRFKPDTILAFEVADQSILIDFLCRVMPDRKRSSIKQLLKFGSVMVNGNVTSQFNVPLNQGDTVKVNLTRAFPVFYNRRVKIVYEDDDIIVIEKGYGLLSMGNEKIKDGTAYSILKDYLKEKDPRNKIFIIHRLDRDTSGLMMFAKTIEAKEAMQHNWNNMVLERTYLAVVEGKVEEESGTVKSYLAENSQMEVYSTDDPEKGQLAVTRWKKLASGNGYTLMEVSLDTGRKNQIRVHMKDIEHPIAGDRKYGAKSSPIHRLALHAQTLRFVHPVTRRDMRFETPIPASFEKMIK